MADLQALTDRLQIEVGTLRTAMSRLAKDGWVIREKRSRSSFYSLSPSGHEEFARATVRIYEGNAQRASGTWVIGLAAPATGRTKSKQSTFVDKSSGLLIAPGVGLWRAVRAPSTQALRDAGFITLKGGIEAVPDWIPEMLANDPQVDRYRSLMARLQPLRDNLTALHSLSPLDAMALRTLLIHDWRRTMLRLAEIPPELAPPDWPEAACRDMVGAIYHALLSASENWWQAPITPDGMDALEHRFPSQAPVTLRNFIES